MFRRNSLRILILISLAVIVPQTRSQNAKPVDPQEKPRQIKPEPDKALSNWLRDVEPILTAGEIDAWKKLQTNEEREKFIEIIWHMRDPDPDTEENEYR